MNKEFWREVKQLYEAGEKSIFKLHRCIGRKHQVDYTTALGEWCKVQPKHTGLPETNSHNWDYPESEVLPVLNYLADSYVPKFKVGDKIVNPTSGNTAKVLAVGPHPANCTPAYHLQYPNGVYWFCSRDDVDNKYRLQQEEVHPVPGQPKYKVGQWFQSKNKSDKWAASYAQVREVLSTGCMLNYYDSTGKLLDECHVCIIMEVCGYETPIPEPSFPKPVTTPRVNNTPNAEDEESDVTPVTAVSSTPVVPTEEPMFTLKPGPVTRMVELTPSQHLALKIAGWGVNTIKYTGIGLWYLVKFSPVLTAAAVAIPQTRPSVLMAGSQLLAWFAK